MELTTATTRTTDGAVNPNQTEDEEMETTKQQPQTMLNEAKEWLESEVEVAENGEVSVDDVEVDSDVLPLLARLTTCGGVFPGTTRTYGDIAEEIAENEGGLTYATDEADELPGCEVETAESECSRCHQSTTRTVCTTTDRRLAVTHEVPWTLVLGEFMVDIELDHKGRASIEYTNASATAEAEFDDDEAGYSDEELAALLVHQQQEAAEAKAAAERQYQEHVAALKAERARLLAEVPMRESVHPYLRQRAVRVLDGTEPLPSYLPGCYDTNADARALYQARQILTGRLGTVWANGKSVTVWDGNIGGAKVAHLRENGMIAVIGEKGAREYMRPSELFDQLLATERAAVQS